MQTKTTTVLAEAQASVSKAVDVPLPEPHEDGQSSLGTKPGFNRVHGLELAAPNSPSKGTPSKKKLAAKPFDAFQHDLALTNTPKRLQGSPKSLLAQARALLTRINFGEYSKEKASKHNIEEETVVERWNTMNKLSFDTAEQTLLKIFKEHFSKRYPESRIHRSKDQFFLPPCTYDSQVLPWKEPSALPARVLAPVDHPTKPAVFPSRPYVESAVKRGFRKHRSKKDNLRKIVLKSQEDHGSPNGDPWGREYIDYINHDTELDLTDHHDRKDEADPGNQPRQERQSEREDSVPPSTPVPDVQPNEENIKEPEDEIHQEAREVLDEIVNQIISENKTTPI